MGVGEATAKWAAYSLREDLRRPDPRRGDGRAGCGATALGFLVGLTHRAEDEIGEATARDIVARLPAGTEAVLVTHLLDPERVADLAAVVGARTVQVHGDMAVADLRRLRALAPGLRLLKAVHVTGGDVLGRARAYADAADALVLDSRSADRLGGTGLTHDWAISARIVAGSRRCRSTSRAGRGRRTSRRPSRGCARPGWT